MNKSAMLLFGCLLLSHTALAAFFVDVDSLRDMRQEFEYYQENRQIRYMAKASQYTGYVTGIVDALDGGRFCLPGGVDAEQAAWKVAAYLSAHPAVETRRGSENVVAALSAIFPCQSEIPSPALGR